MAAHALRQSSRVRYACRWVRAFLRRARWWLRTHPPAHVPFALYTAATLALMAWTICAMICVTH